MTEWMHKEGGRWNVPPPPETVFLRNSQRGFRSRAGVSVVWPSLHLWMQGRWRAGSGAQTAGRDSKNRVSQRAQVQACRRCQNEVTFPLPAVTEVRTTCDFFAELRIGNWVFLFECPVFIWSQFSKRQWFVFSFVKCHHYIFLRILLIPKPSSCF